MSDIKAMNAKARVMGIPHFLMGHSAGGFLALNFIANETENAASEFSGIIASAPLTVLDPVPPMVQRLAVRGIGYFLPSLAIPNGLNTSDLCSDVSEVQKYEQDPNVHGYISLGTAKDVYPSDPLIASLS